MKKSKFLILAFIAFLGAGILYFVSDWDWKQVLAAPDIVTYDFSSGAGSNKWAYEKGDSQPSGPTNYNNQAESGDYTALASSNNSRWQTTLADNDGEYDSQIYAFTVNESVDSISQINVQWEGYGETQSNYYTYLKIWNKNTNSWELLNSYDFTVGTDQTLSGSKTTNIGNYIDASSKLYVLATTKKYAPSPACGGVEWGGYCWYEGAAGQNCVTVCSSYGGNVGTCQENDNTSCELCRIFHPGAGCMGINETYDPIYFAYFNRCDYRASPTSGSCATSNPGGRRFCACNE